jgi:hypothetical protein
VATRIQEAQDPETHKATNKALHKVVALAKHSWVNEFLHGTMPEHLWMAVKWHFGHKQRLIPALTTDTGLSDHPAHMATTLRRCFFKMASSFVPTTFPDDPPPQAPCSYAVTTTSEIADALCPTSNNSAPGPLGHNYKLIKWAFAANPA